MFSKISRRYSLAFYNVAEKINKVNEVAQESEKILELLRLEQQKSLFK